VNLLWVTIISTPGFICEPAVGHHQHSLLWVTTSIPGFISESAVFLKALLASSMQL
jgi:hypothetical protein